MNGLCPECRNVPQYHSFCTQCCTLFHRRAAHWCAESYRVWRRIERRAARAKRVEAARQRRRQECEPILAQVRALRSQDMMAAQAENALGMTPHRLGRYCRMAGMPPFRRPPKQAKRRDSSPAWPVKRLARLERLLAHEGASYRAAAAKLKTSRSSIAWAVRDFLPELLGRKKGSRPCPPGRPIPPCRSATAGAAQKD